MSHPRFAAVWFDLDGTLFDSAHDLIPAIIATVQAAGLPCADFADIRGSISQGSRAMIACAANLAADDARLDGLVTSFHQHYLQRRLLNRYFDGMETLLAKIEAAQLPWGIITNKNTAFAQAVVSQAQLDRRIAALVCGDTLPQNKPHPAPLLFACAHINANPADCLYVGDSESDIQAARAAGMPGVACRYGYLPPDSRIETWQADYIIEQASELADIIGV